MHTGTLIVLAGLGANAFVVVAALLWIRSARTPAHPKVTRFLPPVSILKPLKGFDEGLEDNLESFASLDYPSFQLLLGVADPDDPALDVARRVAARHPERDIQVLVGEARIGRNPKVNLLAALLPRARHELCLISDSNVRAHAGYLRGTVAALADDPDVGLVSNPVVGIGEQSAAAFLENLHLSAFLATANVAAKAVAGVEAVVGKSMLFRRQALADMGGLRAVRNVLAEDQLIALKMTEAGWAVRLAPEPVRTYNARWSVRQTMDRHARWGRIRLRLAGWVYPLELLGNPLPLAVLAALLGTPHGGWLVLGTAAARIGLDALALWGLRGALPTPAWYLLLVPVKDLVLFATWFLPFSSRDVVWRGNRLRIAQGTRLVRPDALQRARSMARAGRIPGERPAGPRPDLDAAA